MDARRVVECRGMSRSVRLATAVTALAFVFAGGAEAADAFTANGSVRQVYATGLTAGAPVSLLNAAGRTVATKRATALGGVLFRGVRPGTGYRVRLAQGAETSAPLTVLSTRPAPPSTAVYNQTIPSSGYGYLTTRDGTKLAINVHPPQDITNVSPVPLPIPHVDSGRARR